MATRMLIDARHPEETRVAVIKGNRIEEFDFESEEHRQIKGNIYLAKVIRVEPSLQAAFVEFGGNRHGFLAFSEIHPDYYQIPKEDREALLAEEAAAAEEEERLRDAAEEDGHAPDDAYGAGNDPDESLADEFAREGVEEIDTGEKDDVATIEGGLVEESDYPEEGETTGEYADQDSDGTYADRADHGEDDDSSASHRGRARGKGARRQGPGRSRAKQVDEARERRMALRRRYKIQDVIQRRQVLLVQVVKEERGNKGAALTTYLSLAGRYTVLMPNSSHGGGISRKISSASDRKRLKTIVSDLVLPKSMGLIVRTAGLSRNKTEIKRDFDYLARLWDEIREKTLASSAPKLIHSDSDLIKRAIRDIYNRDIEEVVVEGEDGCRSAREFMKLLMPSHARRVKAYTDPVPLFQRYGAEDQLRAMYDPVVQLKSGGYLVINPTEALVSIDINSGRSTKEHGIEATALSTNLEAAREIARQLRLRDMAGLVVIDFIDMEYSSNIRKVEKAMKDALKDDRARIQVGRISGFGLMEMSRQRLRTGVLEATTRHCPHCDGTGLVRTASSAGLSALRLIEDEAARGKGSYIRLGASIEASIYLLNAKRADLAEIEARYGVAVEVVPEGEDEGAKMSVSSSGPRPTHVPAPRAMIEEPDDFDDEEELEDEEEIEAEQEEQAEGEEQADASRKRRSRRRGGRGRSRDRHDVDAPEEQADADDGESYGEDDAGTDDSGEKPKKRRRRGGRRRRKGRGDGENSATTQDLAEAIDAESDVAPQNEPLEAFAGASDAIPTPKRKRAPRKPKTGEEASAAPVIEAAPEPEPESRPKPRRKSPAAKAKSAAHVDGSTSEASAAAAQKRDSETEAGAQGGEGDSRRGWWQRTFGE